MTTETTSEEFRFRDIAVVAYAPSIVSSMGHGAVMPVLALRASDLGADASMAAFVVALLGIGSLATSLPAGSLVARIGERRTLMGAGALDAVAMTVAFLSSSVAVLAVAVFVSGMSWTAFLIARQGFLIDATPLSHRARAMSLLGGSFRLGVFVGPLLGAGLIHLFGVPVVFLFAAAMSLTSAVIGGWMPELGRTRSREQGHLSVRSVLWTHRRTFATLGIAVVIIGISRSVRTGLLPLWADHIHLEASVVSLLFAGAALVDIALTLPGGWLLDHRGRQVVAIPVVLAVGLGCLLLPLTHDALSLGAVMALIAIGNGLGSGIVMTLGADAAPADGRAQFLGGWRLCGDLGGTGGPLLVSGLAAVFSIAAAPVALGLFSLAGTVWVGYWTGRADRARLAAAATERSRETVPQPGLSRRR